MMIDLQGIAFDAATASTILKLASTKQLRKAHVWNADGSDHGVDETRRVENIVELNDKDTRGAVKDLVRNVLVPHFNIEKEFGVTLEQITYSCMYDKFDKGCFFEKHVDQLPHLTKSKDTYRVITAVIALSDGSGIKGGELIMYGANTNLVTKKVKLQTGQFYAHSPSQYHEVTKVTKGSLDRLVVWVSVPNPYKETTA
jgi:predicted 2-oxoglutarate/Fe(II)-dependent dioxygenase YbiX